jgi:hypothetical protein
MSEKKIPEASREAYRRAKGLGSIRAFLQVYCGIAPEKVTGMKFGDVERLLTTMARER